MNLTPDEAVLVRRMLDSEPAAGDSDDDDPLARLALLERLNTEAPPLGAHVFQLVCELGGEAAKKVAANTKERKALRETLGVKALPKGAGPAKVVYLSAPTLNEYNGLDPWQKEALRKAYDEAIEALKSKWPAWSCGSVDRLQARPGKTSRCKRCKGSGTVMGSEKKRPVQKTCPVCNGAKVVGAAPIMVRDGGRRRAVYVVRESSARPDEESLDGHLGAKIPVDRLVQAGVLRGDSHDWLVRYGTWKRAKPGEGRVVVDVYEIADG